ncbi:hypothetical protein N7526_004525 [Penicillium atrosanguineum]|nr:hypothetical protein N7526_004525 [Penicillium atrosanguineum]
MNTESFPVSEGNQISRLANLPTELLDQTVLELPVEHMVMAMSVSRRFKTIISNNLNLMLDRAMQAIEEDRLKVMLTFAPPAFAQGFVLCRNMTTNKMDGYVTAYSSFSQQGVCKNFLQVVDIDDDEAFTQVKVSIQIAWMPSLSWFTNRTLLLDSTIRLSHDWLDQGTGELLWLDDAKSFGLHLQSHPKQVPNPAEGTSYYDLEVDGLHIQANRFLAAVKDAERKEEEETHLTLTQNSRFSLIW